MSPCRLLFENHMLLFHFAISCFLKNAFTFLLQKLNAFSTFINKNNSPSAAYIVTDLHFKVVNKEHANTKSVVKMNC